MPIRNPSVISTKFTEHYKFLCRHAWYAGGRPDGEASIMPVIPADESGRKPAYLTLVGWRDTYSWDAWADSMDAQVDKIVEDDLINERVKMLRDQASLGKELQTKALDYLRVNGFDSSSSAVSAIKLGVDTERTSRGISDRLVKMTKLTDEELSEETQKLLDRAMESGEIIDVQEVKLEIEKEDIDEDAEV